MVRHQNVQYHVITAKDFVGEVPVRDTEILGLECAVYCSRINWMVDSISMVREDTCSGPSSL